MHASTQSIITDASRHARYVAVAGWSAYRTYPLATCDCECVKACCAAAVAGAGGQERNSCQVTRRPRSHSSSGLKSANNVFGLVLESIESNSNNSNSNNMSVLRLRSL